MPGKRGVRCAGGLGEVWQESHQPPARCPGRTRMSQNTWKSGCYRGNACLVGAARTSSNRGAPMRGIGAARPIPRCPWVEVVWERSERRRVKRRILRSAPGREAVRSAAGRGGRGRARRRRGRGGRRRAGEGGVGAAHSVCTRLVLQPAEIMRLAAASPPSVHSSPYRSPATSSNASTSATDSTATARQPGSTTKTQTPRRQPTPSPARSPASPPTAPSTPMAPPRPRRSSPSSSKRACLAAAWW